MTRSVRSAADLLRLLDALCAADAGRGAGRESEWWDRFYDDRSRGIPFFRAAPDESLVQWYTDGMLAGADSGRALDVGCGPGRNAVWLAQQGYQVDALDVSPVALAWARERAAAAEVTVNFIESGLDGWQPSAAYDLVYDSGCFHHLAPHRRITYRRLLEQALAPGGVFGLACFASGAMGSELSDEQFYRVGGVSGGLAYAADDLRAIFDWLTEIDLRRMRQLSADDELFGESFLWAALFRREPAE